MKRGGGTELKNNLVMLRRHFSTARNNIKRSKKRFFLPVLTIFITLTFVSFLLSGILNIGSSLYGLTQNSQISILVDDGVSKDMKKQILGVDGVDKIKYLSKEDQLNELSSMLSKDWKGFSGEQNPLKDSYVATVSADSDVERIERNLGKIKGVQLATDNRDDNAVVARNVTILVVVLIVTGAGTILFSSTSIASVIELSLSSREREIEIMRLLGATKKFVRFPFELEGGSIGLFGAILSLAVNAMIYVWCVISFGKVFREQGIELINPVVNSVIVGVVIIFLGVVTGMFSARMRSNRLLEF